MRLWSSNIRGDLAFWDDCIEPGGACQAWIGSAFPSPGIGVGKSFHASVDEPGCHEYTGSSPGGLRRDGAWRSLVAHLLWEQGVAGSNPAAPTRAPRWAGQMRP